ncbi:unnamed protein product [Adineta steineri]|uniref:Solute-binding protein family 3/N-terminal domain-containing protein n=1 Tax=Adineta steineri TaxID=433720 RepID=A0A814B0M9_9BILA|nr:unnamed protein product [Adineta steineri]CAF0922641.1 unnamed protein product [Adineta steineri]
MASQGLILLIIVSLIGLGNTNLTSSCDSICNNGCTVKYLRTNIRCYLQSKQITIITATDQTSFITHSGNNPPSGFDVDLMKYIGDIYQINFLYQYGQFSQFVPTVQNNTNIISISTQTDTLAREQLVNFVQFYTSGTGFIVRSTYHQTVNGLNDLCGKTVVVLASSTQESDVQAQNVKCKVAITMQSVPSISDMINAVQMSAAEVGLYGEAVLKAIARKSNNQLKVVGQIYDIQPRGILCNKRNMPLCCALVTVFAHPELICLGRRVYQHVYQAL